MWRRACLGSRDDLVSLSAMWGAFVVSIGLIAAGTWSWGHGLVAALLLVGVPWLPFRTDRRRWDRVVEASYADCLAQAEQILKGR